MNVDDNVNPASVNSDANAYATDSNVVRIAARWLSESMILCPLTQTHTLTLTRPIQIHVSNNAKLLDQTQTITGTTGTTVMGDVSNGEASLQVNGDYVLTSVSPQIAFTTGGSSITLTFKSAFPSISSISSISTTGSGSTGSMAAAGGGGGPLKCRFGNSGKTQTAIRLSNTGKTYGCAAPPHSKGIVSLEVMDSRNTLASVLFTYMDLPVLDFMLPDVVLGNANTNTNTNTN